MCGAVDKRVLIVSPPDSYRIVPYVRAARSLNLEAHLASHGDWALTSPDAAGVEISFDDPRQALEQLLKYAGEQKLDAVIGTDDSTLVLAAELARQLGLQQNPPQSVNTARRKDLSRQALEEAGVAVPGFQCVPVGWAGSEQPPLCGFPCVSSRWRWREAGE